MARRQIEISSNSHIRVLDDLSTGKVENLAGLPVQLMVGDIRDERLVEEAIKGVGVVVHLASHTNVIESIKAPELNFEVSVRGTLNLLQASVKHGVKRFISASTGGVLGDVEPPVHEEMAPHPLSPYGAGKLAGEGYCSAFWGSFGLKTICLRFTNIYGPYSYHKGSVIPLFFRQVQTGKELIIYGDGEQTRDFLYVTDLCLAIIASLKADLPFGRALQLGSGQETSINQLVALMRQVVGEEHFPPVRYLPSRAGELRRNFVSIGRAQKYLNFSPQTDLLTGLKATWNWFQQQGR